MKKTVILLALCFLAVSCLNRKSDKPTTDTTQAADSGTAEKDTLPTESELEGYPIDYHSVKVIETVYVTDRRASMPGRNPMKMQRACYITTTATAWRSSILRPIFMVSGV